MTPPTDIPPHNRFLSLAWSGRNIFLTGMAGTGKSTLLREFIAGCQSPLLAPSTWPDGTFRPTPPLDVVPSIDITAPTGIAALNVAGRTIHRWSGMLLGPKPNQTDEQYWEFLSAQPYPSIRAGWARVEKCQRLVIDEISMLPGRQFQFLEFMFRRLRGNNRPWGGCQVIVIGDFLQLAPVRTSDADPYDWAFLNPTWQASGFEPVVLTTVHRQANPEFVAALAGVRAGEVTGRCAKLLHNRVVQFPRADIPRLFTHNTMVNRWNGIMLSDLPGNDVVLNAGLSGNERNCQWLSDNLMCPAELVLKPGARVMTTINDKDGAYVNGSIGVVEQVDPAWDAIVVRLPAGPVAVQRFTWKAGERGNEGTFTQFPLRLAYAMTIHKSQGLTLDAAFVDVRAARDPGQCYVALSRVRSLPGLHLKDWFRGVYVSNAALRFYASLENPYARLRIQHRADSPRIEDPVRAVRTWDKGPDPAVPGPARQPVLFPSMADTLPGGSELGGDAGAPF